MTSRSDELGSGLAETERVTCGVRVDAVAATVLGAGRIDGIKGDRPKGGNAFVRRLEVVDLEVEVRLLRNTIGP